MRNLGLACFVVVGCQGELVEAQRADVGTESAPDVATSGCTRAHGPAMVLIDAGAARYCIDTTEVTVRQFNEFVSADGAPYDAPLYCKDMKLARPPRDDTPASQNLPVRSMTWCHANAYCKWAGKRLCGKIGDRAETVVPSDARSEWIYACQNGARATRYPYGSAYDAARCHTGAGGLQSVQSFAQCHGTVAPFDAIFDMSGNVAELDAFLTFAAGGEPMGVRTLGRAYGDGDFPCASPAEYGFATTFPQVGFRCCADP